MRKTGDPAHAMWVGRVKMLGARDFYIREEMFMSFCRDGRELDVGVLGKVVDDVRINAHFCMWCCGCNCKEERLFRLISDGKCVGKECKRFVTDQVGDVLSLV